MVIVDEIQELNLFCFNGYRIGLNVVSQPVNNVQLTFRHEQVLKFTILKIIYLMNVSDNSTA